MSRTNADPSATKAADVPRDFRPKRILVYSEDSLPIISSSALIDEASDQLPGNTSDQIMGFFRSRLQINDDPLTRNKIVIWILDPFRDCLDLSFIWCTHYPNLGDSSTAYSSKFKLQDCPLQFVAHMALSAYIFVIDHDDQETFGHYKNKFLANFQASNEALKDYLPEEDAIAIPGCLLKKRRVGVERRTGNENFMVQKLN